MYFFFWAGGLPQVWKGTNYYYFFIYFQLLVFISTKLSFEQGY